MVAKISIKLSCNLDRVTTVILKFSPYQPHSLLCLFVCVVCAFV